MQKIIFVRTSHDIFRIETNVQEISFPSEYPLEVESRRERYPIREQVKDGASKRKIVTIGSIKGERIVRYQFHSRNSYYSGYYERREKERKLHNSAVNMS